MHGASRQAGDYPRPQLVRGNWDLLDGEWSFAFDDSDVGLEERWWLADTPTDRFPLTIRVPFTFEASLSGIGDTTHHHVVWYRHEFDAVISSGDRVLLHFGGVDQSAMVWVDGRLVGRHRGGQTAFEFDITDSMDDAITHQLVVRAEDTIDVNIPRGKQEWGGDLHEIWYERATGIWKSVWVEQVGAIHVRKLRWHADVVAGTVTASVVLNRDPAVHTRVEVELFLEGSTLGTITVGATERRIEVELELPRLRNRQDSRLMGWTPEHPVLLDATVTVSIAGQHVDSVESYLGVRSVAVGHRALLLNERPRFVRAILEQGYWADGLWTAPSSDALRKEVELILALGFNTVRVHQKVEDARFLYWCDRLGLMVWGEIGAAYAFSPEAIEDFTSEWIESVHERRSHPSVVVWVPFNESWGVNELATSASQREFVRGVVGITRALDPTRPVISNDGWEHVDSDLISIHDYSKRADEVLARFDTADALADMYAGMGPNEHRVLLDSQRTLGPDGDLPVLLSEFGGVAFATEGTWGYGLVRDAQSFEDSVSALFAAAGRARMLAGYCYTQLTDTAQEANGLLREDRTPKLDMERIRSMVLDTASYSEQELGD